jgi:transmembrane sensor
MEDLHRQYFIEILKKYRLGNATSEEINFLEAYYNLFEFNDDIVHSENEDEYSFVKNAIKKEVDRDIIQYQKKLPGSGLRSIWVKVAAAATILVFFSVAGYFLIKDRNEKYQASRANIAPGGNKAMLTLSNGKKIMLDDVAKGEIAQQSGVSITKTASGQIVYNAIANKNGTSIQNRGEVLQNTFSTPKGGQYQIVLPDGTTVFLNAASSLIYPTSFHGTERVVTLTGEAYFEVAKNKDMPFRVKSGIQTVEVLGTHFNINAYTDESAIKTTLLEGSVKVSSAINSSLIVPGEQSVVNKAGNGTISKHNVNLEKETAWKNGVFSFENDDLKSIMRQVARWYDVDVVYEGNLPDERYFGEISRKSNLSEVFKILELNNIKFDVEGKTVKVSYNR